MVLFNKQRYEFFSKSQRKHITPKQVIRCCSISKDTNFSANHNIDECEDMFIIGVVQ